MPHAPVGAKNEIKKMILYAAQSSEARACSEHYSLLHTHILIM
jgi:hypothetical protein